MSKYVLSLQSGDILDVFAKCNLDVMGGYMVGKLEVVLKCKDWLLVRDNLGKIWRYIWNVISLEFAVTCREHMQGTSHMCLIWIWWLHCREMDPVPSMFLRCSYLFPEVLAPSES